jgi:alpha/beta superfamily hydrolase
MDNNVVWALAEAADRTGAGWLRFNFRGVGRSEGSFEQGRGEVDDIRHALNFLAEGGEGGEGSEGGPEVILAGYSFGAWVASGLDPQPPVKATILIAPPEGMMAMNRPENLVPPILVIVGDQDQFGPRGRVEKLVTRLAGPCDLEVLPGVDHFFNGAEGRLIELVTAFLNRIDDNHEN